MRGAGDQEAKWQKAEPGKKVGILAVDMVLEMDMDMEICA